MLELYSLFKQAKFGDNKNPKPSILDIKDLSKWNSWISKQGLSKDESERQYVLLVNKLEKKYNC